MTDDDKLELMRRCQQLVLRHGVNGPPFFEETPLPKSYSLGPLKITWRNRILDSPMMTVIWTEGQNSRRLVRVPVPVESQERRIFKQSSLSERGDKDYEQCLVRALEFLRRAMTLDDLASI